MMKKEGWQISDSADKNKLNNLHSTTVNNDEMKKLTSSKSQLMESLANTPVNFTIVGIFSVTTKYASWDKQDLLNWEHCSDYLDS